MSKVEIYHNKKLSLDLIEKTFEVSFPVKFNKAYWEWRFLNNPNSEKTYISYIIEDDVLAAYYAVSPMKLILDGKEVNIALSNMTMTHPDYRGRGYFKKLTKELFSNLKDDGFIAVFGFANHNSHYGFRKYMNWIDLSVLNIFQVKPEYFRNIKIVDNEVIFKIEDISNEVLDSISSLSITVENKLYLKRDRDNIEWRLKNNPTNTYKVQVGRRNNKIVSLMFFKTYNDEVDIMEFFFDKTIKMEELSNYAISELIKSSNSTINLWSNLHSSEHIDFEKQGFQETGFNTYFGVIPLIDNHKILDYKQWHYRFLDSDIF